MEIQVEMIQKQIQAKDSPLKVAETRLLKRTGSSQPCVKSCNDKPHQVLVREVRDLHKSSQFLKNQLDENSQYMNSLKVNKKTLEEDIRIKTYSILIDKMKCMAQLRTCFPYRVKTSRIITI